MITGRLHSIETFGAVDGPGIRTVFFLQGCPARCIYCHNPDTWAIHLGRPVSVDEIVSIAKRGVPYYGKEGGVTFSGGEPLCQGEFLSEAMDALAQEGIRTVIDTSGSYVGRFTGQVIGKSQMLLLDIKHSDPLEFEKIAGVKQTNLLTVIELANESNTPVWVRQVIVPGINDTEQNIKELKSFAEEKISNLYKIELLGYHDMAIDKWKKLDYKYQLEGVPPMDKGRLAELNKEL